MNIHLYTNGAIQGPYPLSQIESMRRRGKLVANALYRVEGTKEWRSVSEWPAAPAKQGFFLTYIWPVIYWALYWALLYIAAALFVFVYYQKQARQTEQARQTALVPTSALLDANNLLKADSKSLEDWKRILTLRQTAHDSMCHVFTAQLPTKMQAFLDMDYYLTISQKRGAELGSKSGLVATRAILQSLTVDWPKGARPTTLEETISEIQTYTVVYTVYWQAAEGTTKGFYQFEHRFNLQTGETLSVRLLQTGDGS